jgi:hemin uptake protein HemP
VRDPSQSTSQPGDHSTPSVNSASPEGSRDARAVRGPLPFDELAQGQSEVQIEYQGQVYRLRATRNGKLILNK